MKFHIAVNLERMDDSMSMHDVRDHTLEMVQMADRAGFDIAWAPSRSTPPKSMATAPTRHRSILRARASTASKSAQCGPNSYRYMQDREALWEGDVAHDGDFWAFPTATSCPKPVQPQVPMWVAARSPITFVSGQMCWPLTLPMTEAEKYRAELDDAIAKAGGTYNGTFALMRHTAVYEDETDRRAALDAIRSVLGKFGNLMTKTGEVRNGFPDEVPLDELDGNVRVDPVMLEENLAFGSPEQVIAKLKAYEALGVDAFIYYASMGLGMEQQKRSLQLFIDHVLPEFT